jgi:hypothetical protein
MRPRLRHSIFMLVDARSHLDSNRCATRCLFSFPPASIASPPLFQARCTRARTRRHEEDRMDNLNPILVAL